MQRRKRPTPEKLNLLVIECSPTLDWHEIFAESNKIHAGKTEIVVEQAEWNDITLTTYESNQAIVNIRPARNPLPGTDQHKPRTFRPDFILMRSVTHGIANQDSTNLLYGLIMANLPSVNSLSSVYCFLQRPLMYARLAQLRDEMGGFDAFPLIPQTYYPSHHTMLVTPSFPLVVKVGHAHAGYGKMKINSATEFQDFRSLCALHTDYVTAEPFIEWDYDIRIQKIGQHYRAFKRVSSNWKGNVGNASINEDMEMTEQFKTWIDECSKFFGGLDICALDAVHSKQDGKYYILELNDTAIGLVHRHAHEDMQHIRDLVLMRMAQAFPGAVEEISQESSKDIHEEYRLLKDKFDLLTIQFEQEQRLRKEAEMRTDPQQKKKFSFF